MSTKELRVWETISRLTILQHSKFLTVENHVVRLPDGQLITTLSAEEGRKIKGARY